MVLRKLRGTRRAAGTLVETAVVMIPVMMFLFGICEFGRLLLDWNLLNNAAREGCRYALVNNTSSTLTKDVTNVVTGSMAGRSTSFTGFTVTVSGTSNGTSTPVANLFPGDMITVNVTGNFHFLNVIPLVRMPSTVSVNSSVTMVCEGGT